MAKVTVKRETKQAKKEKTAAKKLEVKKEEVVQAKVKEAVKENVVKEETTKSKASSTISVVYQFGGREITEKSLIASVKEIWMEKGNRIKDIQSLNIYMKPEEMAAYYVINDTENGKITL